MVDPSLKADQIQRYSRHIILQDVGTPGVKKLIEATVCVVGAGGLGCPVIQMLATAGIGHIKVIDGDKVELSNLPRQPLHYSSDVGQFKVDSVIQKVKELNTDVQMEGIREYLTKENALEILQGCDYIIDASDNIATKFLINDVCVHLRIPFTIAGVVQWMGQIISVDPGDSTCYRCVFHSISRDNDSMSCSAAGVINTVPSFAGILQANEAIKSIVGKKKKFLNGIFFFDLAENSFNFVSIKRNPECRACADPTKPFYLSENYERDADQCELIP
ncbi:MAG: HesA/MoeB/ThiF family protein [Promethearchaeota archaeon]